VDAEFFNSSAKSLALMSTDVFWITFSPSVACLIVQV